VARHTEHNTERIFAAADAFRENCLRGDTSLLFDGASI